MNLNIEDLNTSDAWLSEQLFAQLKDLNAEYKEKSKSTDIFMGETFQNCSASMPLLDDDIAWQGLKPTHLDTFDTSLKNNSFSNNFDISNQVLDLSHQAQSKERQLEFEQQNNTLFDLMENMSSKSIPEVQNVFQLGTDINTPIFEATEEELKILKYLETQQIEEIKIADIASPTIQIQPLPTTYQIKCINCSCLFSNEDFDVHVCENRRIEMATKPQMKILTSCKSIKDEGCLPVEPACIRLLRENQIRIRRFLKDELKYDVNSTFNSTISSVNPNSGCVMSSSTGSSSSANNSKKQDGPHECTLCERKFVHASGLLRHMEKHALDLIPTPNIVTNNKNTALQCVQSISGLRVVIKCNLCGRIFFHSDEAVFHFYSHFPDSITEEKEIDNCAEIPYDNYIDDAYNNLKSEAESFYNSSISSYHEEKMPIYLKIVVLSCILQCEFCDLVFSEVSYLFVHSACHLPTRRFECFACDIHVKTSKEICNHWHAECVFMRENLKVHHATTQRYFVCNVCENKFQSLDLLLEHRYTSYHFFPRLNKTLGRLQLPCEYCDSISNTAQECVSHYEEKHYKKCKRDKDCNSGSSRTRQYLCDICGKSYTQSSHLWQHLRFHQGVKPFACKEPGCTRKFTIRPDLNDHIRKCHTGERPYHCLVCGKRFLTGSVFYQHRLIHRGERRYECEACGKRFYRADALKNHQRIHTGEKPYGCHFCTKNFRQRGDRDKHIRARHSHLDANARLMMQMHKLQLEAAAAQVDDLQNLSPTNCQEYSSVGSENMSGCESKEFSQCKNNFNEAFMMSSLEFSKNVFESIMSDIIN